MIIQTGGLGQSVMFMANSVGGFNPLNEHLQWTEPHKTSYPENGG